MHAFLLNIALSKLHLASYKMVLTCVTEVVYNNSMIGHKLQHRVYYINQKFIQYQLNGRFCCEETPPASGGKSCLHVETQSVTHAFLTNVCCMKPAPLNQTHKRLLCELDWVQCRGRVLYDRVLLKTTLQIS